MKNARGQHAWTDLELSKLAFAYSTGGMASARAALPHLTCSQISSRAKKLEIRAPNTRGDKNRFYSRLAPLDPESVEPSKWDNPIVKRKGIGQWKADIPAVRWVFDLGVV